jgi:hypothetical protein
MRPLTLATFHSDPLFPRISRVVATILEKDRVVRPIDVLIEMQLLRRDHWRHGAAGAFPTLRKS